MADSAQDDRTRLPEEPPAPEERSRTDADPPHPTPEQARDEAEIEDRFEATDN